MTTELMVFAIVAILILAVYDLFCQHRKRKALRKQKEDERKRVLLKARLEAIDRIKRGA